MMGDFLKYRVLAGVTLALLTNMANADEYGGASLRGAGSTLAQPLVVSWSKQYTNDPYGLEGLSNRPNSGLDSPSTAPRLDYEALGSSAGIQRLQSGAVDFAISEMPLTQSALAQHRLLQFPLAVGAVVVVARPQGVSAPLRLNAHVLSAIYRGELTRWNDARLQKLNPDTPLPNTPIVPLYRVDGSGTSYTFTHYLSSQDETWKARIGATMNPAWPLGIPVKGSSGMVTGLQNTPNSIGYLGYTQARDAGVAMAALDSGGQAVAPSPDNFRNSLASATWETRDDTPQLVGHDSAYPLLATIFGLTRNDAKNNLRNKRTAAFLDWCLTQGQGVTQKLGYLPLPPQVRLRVQDVLARP